MYSSFCSIKSFQTSQSRSIKSFLQCAAECQLTLFIMILTQSQSMLFIAAHTSVKIIKKHQSSQSKCWLKINQKQSKYLMSTLIKMFFILYTVRFYSLMSQLWLKVKKVADWVKCNIIHSKISQNSRAYEMKNTWL